MANRRGTAYYAMAQKVLEHLNIREITSKKLSKLLDLPRPRCVFILKELGWTMDPNGKTAAIWKKNGSNKIFPGCGKATVMFNQWLKRRPDQA